MSSRILKTNCDGKRTKKNTEDRVATDVGNDSRFYFVTPHEHGLTKKRRKERIDSVDSIHRNETGEQGGQLCNKVVGL